MAIKCYCLVSKTVVYETIPIISQTGVFERLFIGLCLISEFYRTTLRQLLNLLREF
jgi:hypothetical protein